MPMSRDPRKRQRQLANLQRGGQTPTAAPRGNQRARTHGAYAVVAADRLDRKQAEVFAALAEDAPLRAPDGGLPAAHAVPVHMLAKALCRLEDVEQFLTLRGLVDDDGKERPALDVERRLRLEVADWCDALGMTPRAQARLGLDLVRTEAMDLAKAMSALDIVDGDEAA